MGSRLTLSCIFMDTTAGVTLKTGDWQRRDASIMKERGREILFQLGAAAEGIVSELGADRIDGSIQTFILCWFFE